MFKREIKIWTLALIIGLFLAQGITRTYAINVQNEIAENVIRFHVISNSDTAEDQNIKNIVRDGVLDRFGKNLDPAASIEETREFLQIHMCEIEKYATQLVSEHGFDYPVVGVIDRTFFPTRTYGGLSFPAGEYEALRLIVGEGAGGNWWCVMFPPLCYVDAATPSQTSLQTS